MLPLKEALLASELASAGFLLSMQQHLARQMSRHASIVRRMAACAGRSALQVQDCEPLWLTDAEGTRFRFGGARAIAAGTLAPEAAFVAPDAVGTGTLLRPTLPLIMSTPHPAMVC